MFQPPLEGLIAATITPLREDGEVDAVAIAPMIDRLIATGVTGLYVCGSTGEGMSLTCEERKQVVEETVKASGGRVPVIVQVGHNSLADATALAAHAEACGADVISATCPSYFKVDDTSNLVRCMQSLAAGAPNLPFYYYHIPALTGSQIDVAEFLRSGRQAIPSLAGLKYTNTLLHEFQHCCRVEEGQLDVVWGCDEMLLAAFATGAKAAIGSTYNIAAPLYQRVIEAIAGNRWDQARDLQYRSVALVNVMKVYSFHSALKAIMEMLGMSAGPCRAPIRNLTPTQTDSLRKGLESIEFFDWCGHQIS